MTIGCGGSDSKSEDQSSSDSEASDLRPIKLGLYTYLTGTYASLGECQQNGAKLAVKQINEAGGINGHPLELVVYDDKATTEVDVQVVTRMVEVDKVDAILGNGPSAAIMATKDITEAAKIMQLPHGTASSWTNAGLRYTFRCQTVNTVTNRALVETMVDLGVEKIGILRLNTEAGADGLKSMGAICDELGLPYTSEAFNTGDTDYTAQLAKMYENGATNIMLYSNTQEEALGLKQIRRMGHDELVFTNEGASSPEVREVAGDAANGCVYVTVNVIPDTVDEAYTQIERDFLAAYVEEYGEMPASDLAYRGYDQVLLYAEAFRNSENVDDKDANRNAFVAIEDFEGLQGIYDYTDESGDGLRVANRFIIWEGKNMRYEQYLELTQQ
jgi:branched-chain amino acid transport system substrate-binding protein